LPEIERFFFSLEDAIEERKQSLAMPVRKQLFVERQEAVVLGEGKSVGESECWGVERWLKKNEVIASRASMGRCAALQLHILDTEITVCLYIFSKQWRTCL